jgi:two-component system, chemotaxis family, response regulator Rcp1
MEPPSNPTVKILLVEDDAGDATIVRESLRESGNRQLVVASSGAAALSRLQSEADEFGLVLLDLSLPDTTGTELLKQIRRLPQCRHLPVVVLTGSTNDEDMRRSYAAGANAYLVKPVDLGRFVRMVNLLDTFWITLVSTPQA